MKADLVKKIKTYSIILLAVFALCLIISQKAPPNFGPLFTFKRVQEKVYLSLKPSPRDKATYLSLLLDNRLEELESVVKNKNYHFVYPSASRYSTLAGQITELVVANNLTDFVPPLKQKFLSHQKTLYNLYVLYPKNKFEDEEYKYIEDDINYLKIYSDKLSSLK